MGCSPGSSADLGIARALMNGYVSRGDRCETEHRCGQAASDQGGKSELLHFDAFFDLCCGAVRGRRTRTFFVGPVCSAFDRSDSSNAVVRALIPVAEIDRQLAGISHFNGRRFAGRQATAQSGTGRHSGKRAAATVSCATAARCGVQGCAGRSCNRRSACAQSCSGLCRRRARRAPGRP